MLRLTRDPSQAAVRGSLGRPSGAELLVSPDVAQVAQRHGLHDDLSLVSWAETFPDALAEELGWSREDVLAGVRDLQAAVGGSEGTGPVRFGANPPSDVVVGRTTAGDLARRRR